MNIKYSPHFIAQYKKLVKKNKRLEGLIEERIKLFISDKTNPSLHLHKLQGNLASDWSISIESNMRIILTYFDENMYFVDIGSHDEVYK